MAAEFCMNKLEGLVQPVRHYRTFMFTLCVLNLVFSLVAILGNLLVIRALGKASSIPTNLKKLFLSLAFSDLAVGLFSQLMYGVIMAVMLNMTANGNYNFDFLCPITVTICYFSIFLLTCASFFNITLIAVDRLLAVSLHLRYQELVTSRRVAIALVSLWLTTGVAAFASLSVASRSDVVTVVVAAIGIVLTSVANIRTYKVVRYHQNQIQSQRFQQASNRAVELCREKKCAFNALIVVFITCYLPHFCSLLLDLTSSFDQISLDTSQHATIFIVFLNSSLNPFIYCWRYREINEIIKSIVKKIFHITDN